MAQPNTPQLFTEATFDKLLNRGHYGIINGQLLFYSKKLGGWILTQISPKAQYTAQQYMQLPESAPYELINGKLIFMAAPFFNHQKVSMMLSRHIGNYVYKNKLGEVVAAPTDVQFDQKNVVQPDLLFVSIARKSIIGKLVEGAPDFVVEISSKSTSKRDYEEKMELYGKYDVIEYWIVKPTEQEIEVYHNQSQTMQLQQTAKQGDTIQSIAIQGFVLEVEKVFV